MPSAARLCIEVLYMGEATPSPATSELSSSAVPESALVYTALSNDRDLNATVTAGAQLVWFIQRFHPSRAHKALRCQHVI